MTTRNIAPRENGEGSIGTTIKRWLNGFFNAMDISNNLNVGGNVTATGVSATNLSVSGTATGVTPASTDNSTKFATTEFVKGFQRADGWNAGTAYSVGNIVRASTLPSQHVLRCTFDGTSDSTEPDCTGVSVGDEILDGSTRWAVDSYLLTSGGNVRGDVAVNGDITLTNTKQIKNSVDNGLVRIQGGRDENMGARIVVNGKSRSTNAGAFECVASNGTTSKTLIGSPSGDLMWSGKKVATTSGAIGNSTTPVYADSNGNLVRGESYVPASDLGVIEEESLDVGWPVDNEAYTFSSIIVDPGTWVVTGHARFGSVEANKRYGIELSLTEGHFDEDTDGAVCVHSNGTGQISLQSTRIFKITSYSQWLCLNGFSTATGSTIHSLRLRAVRIK